MQKKCFMVKQLILSSILFLIIAICFGQNHFFDQFENKMNQVYGYEGPPVQEATQGAFDILYLKFGRDNYNRSISFKASDWSSEVSKFVRIDYDNIPLLNQSDLKGDNLKVIGFSKSGELLQFIEHRDEWVKLEKPGGWHLRSYGDWYLVRTLNGEYAWIFGKPFKLDYSYASVVEKVIPKPVNNGSESNSNFPIGTVILVGIIVFVIVIVVLSLSSTTSSTPSYKPGSYSSSSDFSDSSYSSEYDSYGTLGSDNNQEITEDHYTGTDSTSRCEDCQSIDISGWGFTSKGNGRCKECDGTGHDRVTETLVQFGTLGIEDDKYDCKTCFGTGQCQTCGGTGIVYR
jgi:hypothetical protein